jgi:hypothetical protein
MRIEDAYSPIFWMEVEMRATSTLEELDDFYPPATLRSSAT